MAHPHPSAASPPGAGAQAEIRRLRRSLLGGRGPGAGPEEVLAHTRLRGEIAGTPVPALLERTERRAAEARGTPSLARRRPVLPRSAVRAVGGGLAVVVLLVIAASAVRRLLRP